MKVNFDKKVFKLRENSQNGTVSNATLFKYRQQGDLVTADYSGGPIVYGKVIARLLDGELHMLYNCLTTADELKAGKAKAEISIGANGKLELNLDWEWLSEEGAGTSTYIEI